MSSEIKQGPGAPGDPRGIIEERIRRVLDHEARGLVVVFDEAGFVDHAHDVTTVGVRDAVLYYARQLASYEGD